MFIKDAATTNNTTISSNFKSFTISEPPYTFYEWLRQKRRHISTSKHYKFRHQFLLSIFFISKLVFLTSALTISLLNFTWIIGALILTYYFFNYLIVGLGSKKLKEKQILYFLPFLEIFLVLFQITIFIANSISKPTHWK